MITYHLSRIEKPTEDEKWIEIEENFPDEQLFHLTVQVPWYSDMVNYLACGIMPLEFTYQQKRKLRKNARILMFRSAVD